ncbi:PREDICTED: gustatory receptor for sugar taste 64f-like [Wasmannia auropunctata]|uniref:gustatory receptor for sugar taste 64f-like n=1 Tax=Wasmannia auropunctata TaxID=64793 RepID=UPI0005EF8761|nr:PREDICTED: gustatory receptor for sugar taste 64f-like [Wasmannia auropunctata]
MGGSLKNVSSEAYEICPGMMLKTKRIFSAGSKRSGVTRQKILPFLTRQKKDKVKRTETPPSISRPPAPPRARPFLQNGSLNEQILSANNNDPESFHCAIGPVLALAQFFGVLPVLGIRRPSALQLKFKKVSLRTAYAVFIIGMVLFMAILSVIHMIQTLNSSAFEVKGGIASATAGAIFYGNCLIGLLIFFWLSPRWVTLQRDWNSMEQFIDSNKMKRPKLRWKLWAIAAFILLLAVFEHILSIAVHIRKYDWSGKTGNSTFSHFLQMYCASSHAFILHILNYNFALGIFIFIVSKLATFTWNFTDVFVMMVATGLAERYKTLNEYVTSSASKHRTTIDWSELREDYAALSCVVKKVDNDIAPIILLSFANNLYFICLQLLNGLSKPEDGVISDIYFFESFIFLIGRTVLVTLLASRIYDQSKLILPLLYTCSASTYNVETERLIYLLTTDDIALTGMRFFSITRSFMLAVAGAIVTYEVVLLQFNVAIKK